jgi:outer membrane receptor for monomeric catechols
MIKAYHYIQEDTAIRVTIIKAIKRVTGRKAIKVTMQRKGITSTTKGTLKRPIKRFVH